MGLPLRSEFNDAAIAKALAELQADLGLESSVGAVGQTATALGARQREAPRQQHASSSSASGASRGPKIAAQSHSREREERTKSCEAASPPEFTPVAASQLPTAAMRAQEESGAEDAEDSQELFAESKRRAGLCGRQSSAARPSQASSEDAVQMLLSLSGGGSRGGVGPDYDCGAASGLLLSLGGVSSGGSDWHARSACKLGGVHEADSDGDQVSSECTAAGNGDDGNAGIGKVEASINALKHTIPPSLHFLRQEATSLMVDKALKLFAKRITVRDEAKKIL